jgi:hypothetical protein
MKRTSSILWALVISLTVVPIRAQTSTDEQGIRGMIEGTLAASLLIAERRLLAPTTIDRFAPISVRRLEPAEIHLALTQ